jgi:hypothetical protein
MKRLILDFLFAANRTAIVATMGYCSVVRTFPAAIVNTTEFTFL